MKRFLIFFILIVFVTATCAGHKAGWTKADFHQNEFEKDRQECIQKIDASLEPELFGEALEGCMAEKGYTYEESRPTETGKILRIGGLGLGAAVALAAVVGALVYLAISLAIASI